MTGDLREIPWSELDRNHEQARVCLREAFRRGDEEGYRRADRFETKCRHEKVRRAQVREHNDDLQTKVRQRASPV